VRVKAGCRGESQDVTTLRDRDDADFRAARRRFWKKTGAASPANDESAPTGDALIGQFSCGRCRSWYSGSLLVMRDVPWMNTDANRARRRPCAQHPYAPKAQADEETRGS